MSVDERAIVTVNTDVVIGVKDKIEILERLIDFWDLNDKQKEFLAMQCQ